MPSITTKIAQADGKKWPNIAESYGPYESLEAANSFVENANIKAAGLTIGKIESDGSIKEYWYQPDGQGGLELVEKGGNVTMKRLKFKALFIGNSISQDHITYLPFLLRRTYGDAIDFEISIFYIGGYTISDYVDNCLDGTVKATIFSTAHNTEIWTNENNTVTLQQAIKRADWDIISCQGYWNTNTNDDMSDYGTLVDFLFTNANKPFELAWLIHQSYKDDTVKTNLLEGARAAIGDHPTSILFAPYFAIEYAKDDFSVSDLTPDNTHNREGLPCMIGAYHVLSVLLKKFGIEMKILDNPNKMTSAIWSTLNIPGANGSVDETFGSTANYRKGQKDAIKGLSASEGFFFECKNQMAILKMPNSSVNIRVFVTANNSNYGNTSGGGYYNIGDNVEISATPQSGYEFVCWDDGNTNATRTITVGSTDATYTAIFQPTGMTSLLGINGTTNLGSKVTVNSNTNSLLEFTLSEITSGAVEIPYPAGWSVSQPGDQYHISATVEIDANAGLLGFGPYIRSYGNFSPGEFIYPDLRVGRYNYIDFIVTVGVSASNDYVLYIGWPASAPSTPAPVPPVQVSLTRLNIKKLA